MKKRHVWGIATVCWAVFCVGTNSFATMVPVPVWWGFLDNLSIYNETLWNRADWTNGEPFGCTFKKDNITHSASTGKMELKITRDGKYYCAEYFTDEEYGYGTYSARLKAAKGSGVVTGFFVYHDHTPGAKDCVHNEIDFEILGQDTHTVQLNYFVNCVGNHEVEIPLTFDAAADYHTYTIKWGRGTLEWSIDGQTVQTLPLQFEKPYPPVSVRVNLWNVDTSPEGEDWAGVFTYPTSGSIRAWVDWIKFVEEGSTDPYSLHPTSP